MRRTTKSELKMNFGLGPQKCYFAYNVCFEFTHRLSRNRANLFSHTVCEGSLKITLTFHDFGAEEHLFTMAATFGHRNGENIKQKIFTSACDVFHFLKKDGAIACQHDFDRDENDCCGKSPDSTQQHRKTTSASRGTKEQRIQNQKCDTAGSCSPKRGSSPTGGRQAHQQWQQLQPGSSPAMQERGRTRVRETEGRTRVRETHQQLQWLQCSQDGGSFTDSDSVSDWQPGSPCSSDSEAIEAVSDSDSDGDSIVYPVLNAIPHFVGEETEPHLVGEETEPNLVGEETEPNLVGEETENNGGGKKIQSKRHCCLFCGKMNSKMSTHLQRKHSQEHEVAQIMVMQKGNPERRRAFIALQDRGDFEHNWKDLSSGGGDLILKYRKKKGLGEAGNVESDYRACPHCKALYRKALLSKHEAKCAQKPDGKKMKRGQAALMGRMILPLPPNVSSEFFQKVVAKMKNDAVSRLVQSDSLILKYGERLLARRDIEEHSSVQISGRLRELGRLCQVLRRNSRMQISTLTQAVDPANFDFLLAAVRELGQFKNSTNMCSKGALVLKLGYSLKKCSNILKADAIKNNDGQTREKCERFEALFAADWFDHVSAGASQSVQRARMNKPKLLPSLSDVEKVNELLDKDLQDEEYPVLAKAILASITIFNRKRGGEVQRMKCTDYENSKNIQVSHPDKEILENLTSTEKRLVEVLHRVEIRGKFNRAVPILLTPAMVEGVEKLLAVRALLGIESEYLFVSETGAKPYRGSTTIKEYAVKAGISDSSLFTATSLRKQLATLSQAMEVSKFNQDQLASFLGHDLRVHRNIYRQPLEILQKAKVASILFKVNRGMQVGEDADVAPEEEEIDIDESPEQEDDEDGEDADDFSDAVKTAPVSEATDGREGEEQEKECQELQASNSLEPGTTSGQPVGEHVSSLSSVKQPKVSKKVTKARRSWSTEEVAGVHRQLERCIILNKVPQKHEAEQAIAMEPALKNRTWRDIKYYVYNHLKKSC